MAIAAATDARPPAHPPGRPARARSAEASTTCSSGSTSSSTSTRTSSTPTSRGSPPSRRDDAFLFCNIPAFGDGPGLRDRVSVLRRRLGGGCGGGAAVARLHVDEQGYPIHGHLAWADAGWWTRQFEQAGFTREVEIERAFHRKYDGYMEKRSPARRAYFVFGKKESAARAGPRCLSRIQPRRRDSCSARLRRRGRDARVGAGLLDCVTRAASRGADPAAATDADHIDPLPS